MDIIANLIARVEEYRATNKNPCKNYGTKHAADRATAKVAHQVAEYFTRKGFPVVSARYVVFYVEPWGRWVGALDYTELLGRIYPAPPEVMANGWFTY